ncbi:hypothetical protein FF1_047139 [Malus domestica]
MMDSLMESNLKELKSYDGFKPLADIETEMPPLLAGESRREGFWSLVVKLESQYLAQIAKPSRPLWFNTWSPL